jgi:hypothetical protein
MKMKIATGQIDVSKIKGLPEFCKIKIKQRGNDPIRVFVKTGNEITEYILMCNYELFPLARNIRLRKEHIKLGSGEKFELIY